MNIKKLVKRFGLLCKPTCKDRPVSINQHGKIKPMVDLNGMRARSYDSYQEYINHQSEKLSKKIEDVQNYDREYENIVILRYKDKINISSKSILCLAARLGGEVRAFKSLGALAIGIDIEPGPANRFVLNGDFHELQFANGVFDFVFCNAIDHVLNLKEFIIEVNRVLKPSGKLILEVCLKEPGNYEVIDTIASYDVIKKIFTENGFEIEDETKIENATSFVTWDGNMLTLVKKSST